MAEKDRVVRDLLRAGHKIAAIEAYRMRYGGSLREVKAILEEMQADDGVTGYSSDADHWAQIADPAVRDTLEALIRGGRLIAAIQLYREKHPDPLRYAKQAVLAWQNAAGLEASPAEATMAETLETFDIRWNTTLHPQKQFLFWKQAEAFVELRFEIQIAEKTFDDTFALSWWGLLESKEGDGEYGIFTCICGDLGCGGFCAVEVIYLDGRVLWYDSNDWTHWHLFDEASYKAAISRFETALLELKQSHANLPIKFHVG